jgi:hypothetical protein
MKFHHKVFPESASETGTSFLHLMCPETGGTKYLQNIGNHLLHYAVS